MKKKEENPFAWNDTIQELFKNPPTKDFKKLNLVQSIIPLLEEMNEDELIKLRDQLKSK